MVAYVKGKEYMHKENKKQYVVHKDKSEIRKDDPEMSGVLNVLGEGIL